MYDGAFFLPPLSHVTSGGPPLPSHLNTTRPYTVKLLLQRGDIVLVNQRVFTGIGRRKENNDEAFLQEAIL